MPLTVSCFSKIQIGFTFLVPAHPGSPGKRAVKRLCVCVLLFDYQCTSGKLTPGCDTAHSSECGQCRVCSRCRRLNVKARRSLLQADDTHCLHIAFVALANLCYINVNNYNNNNNIYWGLKYRMQSWVPSSATVQPNCGFGIRTKIVFSNFSSVWIDRLRSTGSLKFIHVISNEWRLVSLLQILELN